LQATAKHQYCCLTLPAALKIGRSVGVVFNSTFSTSKLQHALDVSNIQTEQDTHSSTWSLWRQSYQLTTGIIRRVFLADENEIPFMAENKNGHSFFGRKTKTKVT